MADIKSSVLFQKKKKNPIDKIKNQAKQYQPDESVPAQNDLKENKKKDITNSKLINKKVKTSVVRRNKDQNAERKKLGKGAPDKFLDKSYRASKSVKISPILDAMLKSISEKYETDKTKDEILREALNEYICTHLEKEERAFLLRDVQKELNFFHEKNPTLSLLDEEGNIIKSAEDVEKETHQNLIKDWKL